MSSVVQDALLVYPFLGADKIEKDSVGLPLCNTCDNFTCSQFISHQQEKSVRRNHIQTIANCFLVDALIQLFSITLSY
jgi:hypothetical protein